MFSVFYVTFSLTGSIRESLQCTWNKKIVDNKIHSLAGHAESRKG